MSGLVWFGVVCGALGGGVLAWLLFAWAERDLAGEWALWPDSDPGDETDFDWDKAFARVLTRMEQDT